MSPLAVLAFLACAAAVGLSWALWRRRRALLPFAVFASAMLGADLAAAALHWVCPWLETAGPWTGWRRVLLHVDAALFVLWPIALASAAWVAFLRRRPWAPLAVGAVAVAALVLGYPEPFREEPLGLAYAVIHGAGIGGVVVAFLGWRPRVEPPRPEHVCLGWVALLDAAYFAGPYALPAPWLAWADADGVVAAIWGGACAVLLGALGWGLLMKPAGPPRPDAH